MSPGGRSERIRILRETIARMEGGCAPGLAASEGSRSSPEAETRALERRRLAFFEVAPAHASDAPAAAGFALAVAGRFLREEGGALLWIADEFALLEGGAPYAPGLGAFGLGWRDLVLMRLPRRADVFLALEEAIRSRAFGAVICEPGALSGADAPAIVRRLAMGARTGGARAILLRPPASARAPFLAPTPMRFEVAARPAPRPSGGRKPLPGQGAWRVRHAGPPGSLPAWGPDAPRDLDAFQEGFFQEDLFSAALSLRLPERFDDDGDVRAA